MDGHSGVRIEKVNEASSGSFSFVLTFLEDSSGGGDFVIHATSKVSLYPVNIVAEAVGIQACSSSAKKFWRAISFLLNTLPSTHLKQPKGDSRETRN